MVNEGTGMSSVGGAAQYGAGWPPEPGLRREPPRALSLAYLLIHTLFGFTVLGGLGLLLTAASHDALDGGVIARVAYAAAPGTLGWWLVRRSRQGGGPWVGRGLVAVQAWLILGGLANLAAGSGRAGLQLLLPTVILCFLLQPESRQWYDTPTSDRAKHRPFSVSRMIRWRRDDGQTAVEYAGLVAMVAAIVTALLVSGLGTQIYGGIETQVCKVAGLGCPAATGGTDTRAGTGSTQGTATGTGDSSTGAKKTTTTQGNADNSTGKKDDGCFSGIGAFFGCAGNQIKQVGQGIFVDGVWGDLTGIYDMVRHPVKTLKGLGDYGKQLGHDWMTNSQDARDKWSKGDYLGAVLGWGGASLKTGGTVLYDMFIGDDVAKDWKNGDKTRAVSHVLWNIGSLFIPGYDGAKVVEKVGDLGKLGKLGKLAEEAAEAAEEAKRAAKAGDVAEAEKAAKQADEAAAEAEQKARKAGCTISAPAHRIPYGDHDHYDGTTPDTGGNPTTGSPGTGTTVLAAGAGSPYVVLAQDGCDEEAKKAAEEARKKATEADHAAGRLSKEESEAARKPTVGQGDPKKFKDHFLRHKKLVEDALGTKYKKLKDDGPRFLNDIQENIKNGTFKLVGKGTLKKGEAPGLIYRGKGVTIVLHENGDFWTALKSGEGLDTSIDITLKAQ